LPRPILIALVILISVAWATNLAVGYLGIANTEPSVNAIFALIVGALFPLVRKGRKLPPSSGDDAP
jgi:hypothetical protein